MMSVNSVKGATWRKWDLHIHTPSSIIQSYGGDTKEVWDEFIKKIEDLPDDVKVIGINDYNFIDGYEKVIKEKTDGKLKNIEKVFPVIEFRIDTFGSATSSKFSKVNLHVLFNMDENDIANEIKKIKDEFIGQLHLSKLHKTVHLSKANIIKNSPDKTLHTGFSQIIPHTDEILDLLATDTWKDKVVVFLGYNEWNNLDKGTQLQQFKKHLYSKADAFLTASRDDTNTKKTQVLERFGDKIFFHSLDIHNFKEFDDYNCLTWIKSDPTFKGLKQALVESNNRIFVGISPQCLEYQKDNKNLFIESIQFATTNARNEWFDDVPTLSLNPGLVAIIGDKGNGKSALADSIALAGNSHNTSYSFLCRKKFLSSSVHKKYSSTIRFADGFENTVPFLNAKPNPAEKERVKYLSQSFVTDLCDELDGSEKLQSEIDRVIFSHIPSEKKLGKDSLRELIVARTNSYDTRIKEKHYEIEEINSSIVKMEETLSDDNKVKVEKLLQDLEEKLVIHKSNEPVKPSASPDDDYKLRIVQKYTSKQTEVEGIIEERQAKIESDEILAHNLRGYIDTASELIGKKDEFVLGLSSDKFLIGNGIKPEDIIKVSTNTKPLDSLVKNKEQDINIENTFIARANIFLGNAKVRIDKIRSGLDKAQAIQSNYVIAKQKWENEEKKLIGTKKEKGSITWCKEELKKIKDTYHTHLSDLYTRRQIIMESIIQCILDKEENIKDIYSYVQKKAREISSRLNISQGSFIEFTPKITISDNFKPDFFSYITQNKTGTFYGTIDGNHKLDKMIPSEGELTKETILKFPGNMIKALNHNLSSDPEVKDSKYRTNLKDQLKGKKEKVELYNYLFSFKYLDAKFTIAYDNKPITKLSPGEKGILLLAFYLLIDDSKLPIIIDQPEENIGNKTIFERLVKFINIAKKSRQIIIVTHNANLAIVCDADQILHSHMDKSLKNKLTYLSGSIEFDPIKGYTIDILEGTKDAFDNRRIKYEI